jgi:hypothetical protein
MVNILEIQMQLNKLLEEASEKIEKMNGQYSKQTKMLEYMTEAIKKMNELISKSSGVGSKLASGFETASESAKEAGSDMDSALQKASDKINSTTDSAKKLGGGFGDISKEMTKLNAGISIVGGIGKAISFVANSALAALQTIQGIGSGIFEIGKSVLAFPFKLLDGLISMASVSGSNELAQELEEIRKQFGYLNKTAGGTIIELAKNMKGELANTGLSVWRTFGNLVERLRYFREYAQKLGETIDAVFRDLSVSQAEALGAFNKGLGFTDEGLKGVAQRSLATGENLNEINRQIGNYSIQLSKAFGVSMKLVSRDVGNMIADFEHFGHMAVKEMTQASVFVRRLGIDVKALGKLVDKYMNFEDAANSAAQLSQAFGLNVDAFKLMQEQDPAKKLEMLRKGFFATGRTIENMTAQERRLLAQQTGLGESEIALAFAQKNRALSYADIQKKGDAAKKSQLSQEQVLNKLAGAIERLVKSGSAMQGGFFDRFIQGFVSGIRYSKEFRELMRNLQRSLMMVFYAGRQVGLAFAQLFPGIKEFFGGLRDMFNPRVMKTFLNKVVGAFKDFFKQMTENPATALPKLLDKLQDAFSDRFSAAGSGARKVFDGIKKFFKAVGYIFLSGIKEALLGLGKIVAPLISSIFSDETFSKAGNQISGSVDGIGGTLSKMFRDVFGEEGSPARQKISEALSKFADSIWVAAKFFIGKIAEKLPELFEAIANGLAIGESTVTKSGTGDKFASGLAKSFEKMKPHLIKIAESLGTIILTGLGSALTSPSLWKTIGLQALSMITNMLVVLPAWLGGFVTELFQDLFAGIGRLSTELGDYISEKIGNNIVGKTVKAIWRSIGFVSNVVAIGFKAISRSLYTVGAFFSDVFESPTKAIENLKRRFTGLVGELGNDLKRSFNTLLAGIPDRVKSFLGLTPFVIPTPPPAQNPAVQSIQQAEEQSRTSSKNINENLTNALEITPPSQATRSVQDSSLSERVSSIRDSIQSATEAGRIDQNKATAAFQKLQEFATNLGPVLQTTQTALNKSLSGIDTDKLTSNVESIKSIIENVNSIRNLTARQLQPISISSLIPLENSIDAISTFASSPMLVRLEQALTTAETSTRITGIQNTSNAIKDMVETINQTSRELARLNPINIQTNLNRLASNLGLGNNSVYTIRNENFTVQVNNHVYLDVKELEKVLVERPDTRIRHT